MPKIRGKKPTVAQMKLLNHQVEDVSKWLIKNIHYLGEHGEKSPAKNSPVTTQYVFVHKETGEELVINEN